MPNREDIDRGAFQIVGRLRTYCRNRVCVSRVVFAYVHVTFNANKHFCISTAPARLRENVMVCSFESAMKRYASPPGGHFISNEPSKVSSFVCCSRFPAHTNRSLYRITSSADALAKYSTRGRDTDGNKQLFSTTFESSCSRYFWRSRSRLPRTLGREFHSSGIGPRTEAYFCISREKLFNAWPSTGVCEYAKRNAHCSVVPMLLNVLTMIRYHYQPLEGWGYHPRGWCCHLLNQNPVNNDYFFAVRLKMSAIANCMECLSRSADKVISMKNIDRELVGVVNIDSTNSAGRQYYLQAAYLGNP